MPGPGPSQAEHLSKADLFFTVVGIYKLIFKVETNIKWEKEGEKKSFAEKKYWKRPKIFLFTQSLTMVKKKDPLLHLMGVGAGSLWLLASFATWFLMVSDTPLVFS